MAKKKEETVADQLKEATYPMPAPVAVEEKPEPDADSSKAKIIHAGRPTAVCRCGDKLVRPVKPDNSTWRCLKVWNGNPTEDCQKGIPHDRVLDADQLARLIANKKDRYADAQDIG